MSSTQLKQPALQDPAEEVGVILSGETVASAQLNQTFIQNLCIFDEWYLDFLYSYSKDAHPCSSL